MTARRYDGWVAPGVSPIIREMFDEVARQRMTLDELSKQAGVARSCLAHWHKGMSRPNAYHLEACWRVLGYELRPVRLPRSAPDRARAETTKP